MASSGLGQRLVDKGLLQEFDRRTIRNSSGHYPAAFAKGIVALGVFDEEELADFLADQTHYERAPRDLTNLMEAGALSHLDEALICQLEIVPLALQGKTLTVAMADPLDLATIEQIKFFSGFRIKPVIATNSQIRVALSELVDNFKAKLTPLETFLLKHSDASAYKTRLMNLDQKEVDVSSIDPSMADIGPLDLSGGRSDDHEFVDLDDSFDEDEVDKIFNESVEVEEESTAATEPELDLESLPKIDGDDIEQSTAAETPEPEEAIEEDSELEELTGSEPELSMAPDEIPTPEEPPTEQAAASKEEQLATEDPEASTDDPELSVDEITKAADAANDEGLEALSQTITDEDVEALFNEEGEEQETDPNSEEKNGDQASTDDTTELDASDTNETLAELDAEEPLEEPPAEVDASEDPAATEEDPTPEAVIPNTKPVAPAISAKQIAKLNRSILSARNVSSEDELSDAIHSSLKPLCEEGAVYILSEDSSRSLCYWGPETELNKNDLETFQLSEVTSLASSVKQELQEVSLPEPFKSENLAAIVATTGQPGKSYLLIIALASSHFVNLESSIKKLLNAATASL